MAIFRQVHVADDTYLSANVDCLLACSTYSA